MYGQRSVNARTVKSELTSAGWSDECWHAAEPIAMSLSLRTQFFVNLMGDDSNISGCTYFSSQGAVWGFNTEHTNDHMRPTKVVHSQR